jgi:outer membrane biosynthesis protein TonB
MRLRKTMKRTAAAVLALSMAVSAAALPASAGFNIDMSKVDGDVEITQVDDNGSAKVTIKVGGVEKTNAFSDGKEGNDVTITGDNTKSTATENLNAEEENTSEVEKSGENSDEVEKTGEDTAEAEKTGKTEEQAQEPGSLELLAPEDEEKQAQEKETQEKPADSQEPEQDEKTEQTSDQVIEYDQYDPEAQKEAAKPAAKPAAEQETGEKKAAEEKTYGATNAPTSITEKAQAAARNVVSIINNFTTPLKVILRDLKVDAGETTQNAVTVSGSGNVTLELDGKNELKGGSYWSKDDSTDTDLSGGHGLHAQGNGTLTIQDEDKDGSLTAAGGDVETSSLGFTMNGQWLKGGDGIRASNLTVSGAEIKAEGGNSKVTGTSDMASGGGAGIRVDKGMAKLLGGAHITAKGGDVYSESQRDVTGGTGISIGANAEIEGVSISAAGGSAEGKKYARSGSAMDLYGNYMQYTLSMKDSALELTGGNAKAEGEVSKGPVLSEMYHDNPTLKNLTITAVEGKTKASKGGFNGGLLYFNGGTREVGGNSTITLVGTRTDGLVAKDNTVVNLYVPEGETLKKADSVDKISADETGKVNIYENATTTKNEDGSITVTGDLVGIKQDGHSYELTATVEPTCTTPGKRVYTCTTHEDETYEEIISDALGHHFVNGVCTRCGAPESNGGSSAVTLTVTGAGAYETSIADGRYVVAVPAEAAVLSGSLSNLKELKAQGADTIVFRTQLRETALNIDSMLSLGVDGTLFTLTHSGESAELTVGGFAHNELLH